MLTARVTEPRGFASAISRRGCRAEPTSPQLRVALNCGKAWSDSVEQLSVLPVTSGLSQLGQATGRSCGGWFVLFFENQGI